MSFEVKKMYHDRGDEVEAKEKNGGKKQGTYIS